MLEKDLGDRFNILQQAVSQIFATWIDRLYNCLGQLSFKTDRESTKKNLPKCFKPDYEDVHLIIDCTEIFIEKPHRSHSRVAPGQNTKDTILERARLQSHHSCCQYLYQKFFLEASQMRTF